MQHRSTIVAGRRFELIGVLILFIAVPACFVTGLVVDEGTCMQQWDTSIGQPGMNGLVYALTEYNGDLIAGGWFGTAGGKTVNRNARWDGTTWHRLGAGGQIGLDFSVHDLVVYNGDLIVGGAFATAEG